LINSTLIDKNVLLLRCQNYINYCLVKDKIFNIFISFVELILMRVRVTFSPIETDIIYIYQNLNVEYFVEFVCTIHVSSTIRVSAESGLHNQPITTISRSSYHINWLIVPFSFQLSSVLVSIFHFSNFNHQKSWEYMFRYFYILTLVVGINFSFLNKFDIDLRQ
jgi:hypothetical protein